MAKTFLLLQFLGRTSLCFTDQQTQEENKLGGLTPLWVSSYPSYLLYKAQDLFSACRQSHGQNISSSSSILREDQSLLHRSTNSGREQAWWTNSLVGEFLHQLSLVQSSRSTQRMQTLPWPKHFFLFNFYRGPVFASQTKKLRKRMCLVNQLPCGSGLTPAFSCTKIKIYSAHADSPMAKIVLLLQFLGRTSLCFTDQQTQEENKLGGLTPLWVSSYPSSLLYKAQDLFSACRQSHGQNISSSSSILREDQSLLHRSTNAGREQAWWTNSLVGQFLHQLSLVQSSRSIQRMQTVPWPKHFFLFNFYRGPVFASQTKKLRKRMCLVNQLPCGSGLTPAISCTKIKIYSAHADSPMAKIVLLLQFLGRTSLCFTDQETQEENVLGGPTPLWIGSYTSYLLYKAQDLFSACMQTVPWPKHFFLFNF